MTLVDLLTELHQFIIDTMDNYVLVDKDNRPYPPIYIKKGYFPSRIEGERRDNAPYILVQVLEGRDEKDKSTAKARIIVGIRDVDIDQGWLNTLNVIEHIRQALLTTRPIGGRFQLDRPMEWAINDRQPEPIWIGWIDATFDIGNPELFLDMEEAYSGL